MSGFVSVAISLFVVGNVSNSYREALDRMTKTGQPLVVLVGADGCPACRQMKTAVSPEVRRRGGFENVVYVEINSDREPALAGKLLRGSAIPQLVMYRKTQDGWKSERLTGSQNAADVEQFISRGLQDAVIEPHQPASTTRSSNRAD